MIRPRSRSHAASNMIRAFLSLAFFMAACSASQAQTAPPTGFTVYAAGDIADCRTVAPQASGAAQTAVLIAAGLATDPNAIVLTIGDNTYPDGTPAEFADCYEPTWGKFKARTFPAPGNTEYDTPQAAGYFGYFGTRAGPPGQGYYSFNLGSWHIISLSSSLPAAEHQAQLAWLRADLQANPVTCTLAYWHFPNYSSGGSGNNPAMADAWAVLQAARADLVLVADDHHYERFAPLDTNGQRNDLTGIREFVIGTGGAPLEPIRTGTLNSEASQNQTHGVLKLVLNANGYDWEFLPVADTGFTDRGTGSCH